MSQDFPGKRFYEALVRALDPSLVESVVAPTFADLHYEVQRAGPDRWRRRLAYLRCYLALSRAFVCGHMLLESSMRRLVAVLLLGVLGALGTAASLSGMISAHMLLPVRFLLYFVMAIATPVVLRFFKLGSTYRQMFIHCATIGLFTMLPLAMYLPQLPRASWWVELRGLAMFVGCLAFVSALMAAAAWTPRRGEPAAFRSALVALLTGACVFAGVAGAVGYGVPQDVTRLFTNLAAGAFVGFRFALLSAVVHLPILLVMRRALNGPRSLALVGAIVGLLPMFVLFSFHGGLRLSDRVSPALFLMAAPYILAGAAMGWSLAPRYERRVAAANSRR